MTKTLKLPKEQKQMLVEEVMRYFSDEHDLQLGRLEAETAFDFMLKLMEPIVYNQAVADARGVLQQRMANLEDDLYALEKSFRLPGR